MYDWSKLSHLDSKIDTLGTLLETFATENHYTVEVRSTEKKLAVELRCLTTPRINITITPAVVPTRYGMAMNGYEVVYSKDFKVATFYTTDAYELGQTLGFLAS